MGFAPVRQRRLSDDIVERLEALILEGSLKAGERLPPERALAEQFGVSRPSLREAIQKLAARGLLVSRQGGGTFVAETLGSTFSDPLLELLGSSEEAQRDLLEFRHTLEGACAYYAAQRATPMDHQRLREAFEALQQCYAHPPARDRAEEGAGRCALPSGDRRGQPQRRAAAHHQGVVRSAQAQRGDQHRRHVRTARRNPRTC